VSRRCQLTGREPGFGKSVSHSHRRTGRRWDPNIQSKRYWYPAESRYVRLRLSADAIRTIDRIGVDAAVAKIRTVGRPKKGGA
jgi:large subunit ribosomal protein L28